MNSLVRYHSRPLAASGRPVVVLRAVQPRQATWRVIRAAPRRHKAVRAAGSSAEGLGGQGNARSERAALEADLAALDASIAAIETQLVKAEAFNRQGWEAQAEYKSQIATLTAEIKTRKQQQKQDSQNADAEEAEVNHMLSKVEQLRVEAANMSLTLTERKTEIDGLKRQLSEFEESAQPLRTFATAGLRELEAEAGGVATVEGPNFGNDWGSLRLPREPQTMSPPLPNAPRAVAMGLDTPPEGGRSVLRIPGLPGMLLAAGAMAISNMWKTLKAAFPEEVGKWLDVGAASLAIGAVAYESLSR